MGFPGTRLRFAAVSNSIWADFKEINSNMDPKQAELECKPDPAPLVQTGSPAHFVHYLRTEKVDKSKNVHGGRKA